MEKNKERILGMRGNRNNTEYQLLSLQERLEQQVVDFAKYRDEMDKRWDVLTGMQETNTKLIEGVFESNRQLNESTREIINVWRAANGTVRTLSSLGKFIKWIGGFTAMGAALSYFFHSVVK
jgi:RNAse (barnase) inhibitor barstar